MAYLTVQPTKPDHSLGSVCQSLASDTTSVTATGQTDTAVQPAEKAKETAKTAITTAKDYWQQANIATGGWLPWIVGGTAGYLILRRNK